MFIDETSVKTNMTPLRGRSRKGERLIAEAPFGKWNTQTFIAALRCDALAAPWVIEGAMDGEAFETYVATQLAPILKPGDVVVWDNLNLHKSPRAADAIKARGAWVLFLPPLFPRPESDRKGILQTQSPAAKSQGPNIRRSLESRRKRLQSLHTTRMRKRLQNHRMRCEIIAPRSSCLIADFDGAIFSPEWKEALWDRFFTGAPQGLPWGG